jgi:hypothetical protein
MSKVKVESTHDEMKDGRLVMLMASRVDHFRRNRAGPGAVHPA